MQLGFPLSIKDMQIQERCSLMIINIANFFRLSTLNLQDAFFLLRIFIFCYLFLTQITVRVCIECEIRLFEIVDLK